MPKYSILIPAYNAEDYINETVESILNQQYTDYEIIIMNDGSTDATSEVCEKLAKSDSRITVFEKDNEGLMKTRFALFEKATGLYVICCDSDDKWEQDSLKIIDKNIEEYHPDILMFSYNLWKAKTDEKKEVQAYLDSHKIFDENNMKELWEKVLCTDEINSLVTKVISKSVLPKNWDIPVVSHGEDKMQLIKIVENCSRVLYISDALYDYRIDNVSMTRSFNTKFFDDVITVRKEVWKTLDAKNMLTDSSICSMGCDLLELFVAFIIRLHRSNLKNAEKKETFNKYYNEEIFVKIIEKMEYSKIPNWQKAMLFFVRSKQIWVINLLYDIKFLLKVNKNE